MAARAGGERGAGGKMKRATEVLVMSSIVIHSHASTARALSKLIAPPSRLGRRRKAKAKTKKSCRRPGMVGKRHRNS